ncbi:retinol dehydrogenase 13-like [Ostrinia furnacalis]|uniref:retinol dehydrogenase 13-like n=1 Tax=Ostrinia furnacalis TaxID=93504 RepID=UPI00103DE207|nr:retinol dehydrogenase 13-like [Ostrinia furnacalis]
MIVYVGFILLMLTGLILLGLVGIKIWIEVTKKMCSCKVNLEGKIVVITGGNTGIGFETAKILAKRGATVVIASRNDAKSKAAAEKITEVTGNPNIFYKHLDLGRLASVKKFAEDFDKSFDRLDVLINNAGFTEAEQRHSEDGIENVMQVNHVAHIYLTNLLMPKIVASKPSRIIIVTSMAHATHKFQRDDLLLGKRRLNFWTRYANSKLCNLLSAKAMAKRLPEGVTVNSLHPGMGKSDIFAKIPDCPKKILYFIMDRICKTVVECAQTSVHLACAPSLASVSGLYFDDCEVTTPHHTVTDELAEQVWTDTLSLIEDRTKRFEKIGTE